MIKIFNSDFEISLRILVLLNNVDYPVSVDYVTTIDLFTTYGKNYGFLDTNLHGDISFKFSEISSRRKLVNNSLRELVIKGLIKVKKNHLGFTYEISEDGVTICSNMNSNYFNKYNDYSKDIINQTKDFDEVSLINYATKQSLKGV